MTTDKTVLSSGPCEMDMILGAACDLAAQGETVRSIQVVMARRPTYDQLLRFRARADDRGLTMIVLGQGGVVFRRRAVESHVTADWTEHSDDPSRPLRRAATSRQRHSVAARSRSSQEISLAPARRRHHDWGPDRIRTPRWMWLHELAGMTEGTS